MLKLISALLGFANGFMKWLNDSQQQNAGKALERAEAQKEVIHEVKQAQAAVVVDDPARTERLRNRFDRSRTGDSQ